MLAAGKNAKKASHPPSRNSLHKIDSISDRSQKELRMDLIIKAFQSRTVAATKLNEKSSRSHLIVTLHLTATHGEQNITNYGELNIADLAGNEHVTRSGASDNKDRMKEAKNINLDHLALKSYLLAIKSGRVATYRDRQLTQMMQPCIANQGRILMLITLSPEKENISSSKRSLELARDISMCMLGEAQQRTNKKAVEKNTTVKNTTKKKKRTGAHKMKDEGKKKKEGKRGCTHAK